MNFTSAAVVAGITQTPSFKIGGNLHLGTLEFEELRSAILAVN